MASRKADPEAVALAAAMAEASYLVSQTVTNREWLISHGEDYEAILASRKAARAAAVAAYTAHVPQEPVTPEAQAIARAWGVAVPEDPQPEAGLREEG